MEETGLKNKLKQIQGIWKIIRDEALLILEDGGFEEYWDGEYGGKWKLFELFSGGYETNENCLDLPKTCSAIKKIPEIMTNKIGLVQLRFEITVIMLILDTLET